MRTSGVAGRIAAVVVFLLMSDCRLMPLPTEWSDAVTPSAACDDSLWEHTYFAEDRLTTVALCIVASGTARDVHFSGDGDLIVELETDPRLVNRANVNGWLKLEVVCQRAGDQPKHRSACTGYPGPFIAPPRVGAHIRVTGRYVSDRGHGGWMEIHPISSLEIIAQ